LSQKLGGGPEPKTGGGKLHSISIPYLGGQKPLVITDIFCFQDGEQQKGKPNNTSYDLV